MTETEQQRREKICRAYLENPTTQAWNELAQAIRAESRAWQGLDDETAQAAHAVIDDRYRGDDDVMIDEWDDAEYSVADNGIWVSGMLWVSNADMGLTDEDEEEDAE